MQLIMIFLNVKFSKLKNFLILKIFSINNTLHMFFFTLFFVNKFIYWHNNINFMNFF